MQALPLYKLLDSSDYIEYIQLLQTPEVDISYSVAAHLVDPVELGGLVEAVVVSSGHIYSIITIERMLALANPSAFKCPTTQAIEKLEMELTKEQQEHATSPCKHSTVRGLQIGE